MVLFPKARFRVNKLIDERKSFAENTLLPLNTKEIGLWRSVLIHKIAEGLFSSSRKFAETLAAI